MVSSQYCDHYFRKDGSEYRVRKEKYFCVKKAHQSVDCDGQSAYVADKVDLAVIGILYKYIDKIRETPQDKAIERKYKTQITACSDNQKKLTIENDKLTKRLQALNLEIANALVGESTFTPDQLSEAIKTTQVQIGSTSMQLAKITKELSNKKDAMGKIGFYYDQFLSWADEFESASNEERKMIVGQLIHKVKVSRGYSIEIEFDMNYQQFCAQI